MGSAALEANRQGNEVLHWVYVDAYEIGKYEVTFAEFDRFCEATGWPKPEDSGWGRDRRPVINIKWSEAVAYCKWLSLMTGEAWRLPTEAEWEHAARSGRNERKLFSGGGRMQDVGWFKKNSGEKTHPVGLMRPNSLGIYDMSGNVWELCSDLYSYKDYLKACDKQGTVRNPQGPEKSEKPNTHMRRGGGYW